MVKFEGEAIAPSDWDKQTMKKIVVSSLFTLLLLAGIGAAIAAWHLAKTSQELGHIVDLHEIQGSRYALVIDVQEVLADLYNARARLTLDTEPIFANLQELEKTSNECLSCHHRPELQGELDEIVHLVEEYDLALNRYLGASANDSNLLTLETFAATILQQILHKSETMSLQANANLRGISNRATTRIHDRRIILLGVLGLAVCVGLIISWRVLHVFSRPLEQLFEAMEVLSSAGPGHQIEQSGEGGLPRLIQSFNTMSRSLDESFEALRSTNEELQQRITAHEENEQRKTKLQTQSIQKQKMDSLRTLSGGIAHEFNSILHVISISIERMADRPCDVAANEHEMTLIDRVVQRGIEITQRLLTFCQEIETTPVLVEINDRVRSFANMLQDETLPSNISVQLYLAENIPPVATDPYFLERVLMNLALNAKDSMPEGGVLSIETGFLDREEDLPDALPPEGQEGWVVLKITDTGCGMSDEAAQQIFDPFYTTKDVKVGVGLGLATTYGIVQSCGGQIECRSTPGGGTQFEIYLPPQQPDTPDTR